MFSSGSRSRYIALTFLLGAIVVAAVVAVNRHYFFAAKVYEIADCAANSLEVLRAKRFECFYGAYSRWGLHHPGPALFYCFAAGETLFGPILHWVPTPLNAQILVVLILMAFFLATGIGAAARWVRQPFFVPVAFLLATLHFTSIHLDSCMLAAWPPYVMPIPFFCLIVLAATVAAGQGDDLPVLALTGCFIIHSHVAHPLFVLPLFGLAYLGLFWTCRRAGGRHLEQGAARPWQLFPRAHVIAAIISALFVLPLLVDLSRGANSNFALLLNHLRTHHGERHPYVDAVYYFVRFGAYKPPLAVSGATSGGIVSYLVSHPQMFGLWAGTLLSPLFALALYHGVRFKGRQGSGVAGTSVDSPRMGRWRFLGWLTASFTLTVLLTVFWAHIQDGEMLYYNAWFNFGIYGVLTVFAAVVISDVLETLLPIWPGLRPAGAVAVALCFALAGFSLYKHPARYAATQSDSDPVRAAAGTVFAALAAPPEVPRTKFLQIPDESALGAGPEVAVLLKRLGYEFRVDSKWRTMFGYENALPGVFPANLVDAREKSPMEIWHLVRAESVPEAWAKQPLIDRWALERGNIEIEPAREESIVFAGPGYNAHACSLGGFVDPSPGETRTLTIGKCAVLDFIPLPVGDGATVEIAFDFFGPLVDPVKHPAQRLHVRFNQLDLGTLTAHADTPTSALKVSVPAARWNAARAGAVLSLEFPDAISPAELLGPGNDLRVLAFSARAVVFRLKDSAAPAAATPQ